MRTPRRQAWPGMHLAAASMAARSRQGPAACVARFHVDDLSSAHVYLRLPEGATLDDIPEDTLEDCCQLVKHNSIQGARAVAAAVAGAVGSTGAQPVCGAGTWCTRTCSWRG